MRVGLLIAVLLGLLALAAAATLWPSHEPPAVPRPVRTSTVTVPRSDGEMLETDERAEAVAETAGEPVDVAADRIVQAELEEVP